MQMIPQTKTTTMTTPMTKVCKTVPLVRAGRLVCVFGMYDCKLRLRVRDMYLGLPLYDACFLPYVGGRNTTFTEDDTEELMKELERIKKERAEDAARKQAEDDKVANAVKNAELAKGNPLLNSVAVQGASFSVTRRWDEDVIFKNQARNEPKREQRFINDTIRNDFHRRFLTKYMK